MPPCRELACPPLPWLLNVLDAPPTASSDEYAFKVEPFAPVLTVVQLQADGLQRFLEQVGALGAAGAGLPE